MARKLKKDLATVSEPHVAIADWTTQHYGVDTYRRDEMEALAKAALSVPEGGAIVEIGVYGGCSSSILLQAARGRNVRVVLCDPCMWMWNDQVNDRLQATLTEFKDVQTVVAIPEYSDKLAARLDDPIDLVHIDGDHSASMVDLDCRSWLPKLKSGGLACFHDYRSVDGHDPFPGMPDMVDTHTGTWDQVWHGGQLGLAIRRKP